MCVLLDPSNQATASKRRGDGTGHGHDENNNNHNNASANTNSTSGDMEGMKQALTASAARIEALK